MKRWLLFAGLLLANLAISGCGSSDPFDEAESLMARKRYSPAIVLYDQLLNENPESTRALLGRGRAYAASGETDRAMADFSRAIEVAPDHPEGYYRRAMLFEQLGEPEKAKLDKSYGESIDPAYRQAFAAMENAMLPVTPEDEEYSIASDEKKAVDEELPIDDPRRLDEDVVRRLQAIKIPESLVNGPISQARADGSSPMSPVSPIPPTGRGAEPSIFDLYGPLFPLTQSGSATSDSSTPVWARPMTTTKSEKQQPATAKAPAKAAVAPTRPTFERGATAPNPFVKTPVPTAGPSTPSTTSKAPATNRVNTGAGNSARPTGSPFPQTQVRGTGR